MSGVFWSYCYCSGSGVEALPFGAALRLAATFLDSPSFQTGSLRLQDFLIDCWNARSTVPPVLSVSVDLLSQPLTMPVPKRLIPLVGAAAFACLLLFLHTFGSPAAWEGIPQSIGLGELADKLDDKSGKNNNNKGGSTSAGNKGDGNEAGSATQDDAPANETPFPAIDPFGSSGAKSVFHPGVAKPPGSNYTRTLIMPRTRSEDTAWVQEVLPDLDTAIYVVDDPEAPLHPPKNKGHEVMVYLSYIISNYEKLPDIMIFMHSHRWSWHNNDLLDYDAFQMISRLSSEHVTRVGYFNLRCHWEPGCPDWMHPGAIHEDVNKQEETLLAESWSEIFPHDPVPQVLAQPCCAQFALSRDRVLSVPKFRFIYFRDWLLRTELTDYISGRVWEYLWQYVFTGEPSVCPEEFSCYCDAYGVCFGGKDKYLEWMSMRAQKTELEGKLQDWYAKAQAIQAAISRGKLTEAAALEVPETDNDIKLTEEIQRLESLLITSRNDAIMRGQDPRNRALEAGREWHEGDGF